MKIISIMGARPNFVKMYPLSKALDNHEIDHLIVHTGQHYDAYMSDVFFQEMYYKKPKYNLNIGSASHGKQTGKMIEHIEDVLLKEKPDIVIVPGDTNSTLAGAIAAVKQHIPIAHLEAGLRSFDKKMPEEINRILTDHCSDLLLCPTKTAVANLKNEGIIKCVHKVGDTMFELAHLMRERIAKTELKMELPSDFILCTIHRAENTTDERILQIFNELCKIDQTIIIPLHPRTKNKLIELELFEEIESKLTIIPPLGFLEFSKLLKESNAVITDSGGVQKEAYWNKIPCVTIRDTTEWIETIEAGANVLSEPTQIKELTEKMLKKKIKFDDALYGYIDTSSRIIKLLEKYS
ncbi:MAG: UDP-N-acetylglucosamine 2-epimerase (non-hydrolyzing) [Asgard group archaeon]|nr:UDP-N-acetylglucosamine 2-epimerase (non-hydrolyzing) [Asgard group archaeon]